MSNEQSDIFFRSFIGEYVQIMSTVANEPVELYGYLLHKDESFFYVGAGIERIDAAVRVESVNIIQMADEAKAVHPLIMELKTPLKPEGVN